MNNKFKQFFSKCNSFQVTSDLLNSENLKVAIAQQVKGLQFDYVIADPKVGEQHIKQNSVNEIVFKLQLIYSTVLT